MEFEGNPETGCGHFPRLCFTRHKVWLEIIREKTRVCGDFLKQVLAGSEPPREIVPFLRVSSLGV